MTYVNQVELACPLCAVYNVHLEMELRAQNITYGLPGVQPKLSAELLDVPVLKCYEVSQAPETYGSPCGWLLEGTIDADGYAVFQDPA